MDTTDFQFKKFFIFGGLALEIILIDFSDSFYTNFFKVEMVAVLLKAISSCEATNQEKSFFRFRAAT